MTSSRHALARHARPSGRWKTCPPPRHEQRCGGCKFHTVGPGQDHGQRRPGMAACPELSRASAVRWITSPARKAPRSVGQEDIDSAAAARAPPPPRSDKVEGWFGSNDKEGEIPFAPRSPPPWPRCPGLPARQPASQARPPVAFRHQPRQQRRFGGNRSCSANALCAPAASDNPAHHDMQPVIALQSWSAQNRTKTNHCVAARISIVFRTPGTLASRGVVCPAAGPSTTSPWAGGWSCRG